MEESQEPTEDRYIVKSVEQAIKILEALASSESSQKSLLEICSEVGIHKSKAFSILHTLSKHNYVHKIENRKGYVLGSGLLSISRHLLNNIDIRKLAEPILRDLATRAGGTASLGLIEGDQVYIAAKYEGSNGFGVITNHIGQHFPLSHGSSGTAIAASYSEEDLKNLLKRDDLCFHGDPQRLDRKRLAKELAQYRKCRYALDYGDINPQIQAISSAIIGKSNMPVGFIILFGMYSAKSLPNFGPMVAEGAQKLSHQIDL